MPYKQPQHPRTREPQRDIQRDRKDGEQARSRAARCEQDGKDGEGGTERTVGGRRAEHARKPQRAMGGTDGKQGDNRCRDP